MILLRKKNYLSISLFAVLIFCFVSSGTQAACQVKNVDIVKNGNMTVATIYADGKIDFTHKIITEPPVRVIVDIKNATDALPDRDYYSIPSKMIKSIRTSQFSLEPLITRVVFDIGKPITYTIKGEGNKIILSFPTPDDPDFQPWVAVSPKIEVAKKEEIDSKTEAVKPKKVVRKIVNTSAVKIKPKTKIVRKIPPRKAAKRPVTIKAAYKRSRINYRSWGTRDPFGSLLKTGKGKQAFGLVKIPAVEDLKLVGILQDENGNVALCEDTEGNGYMLGVGDKVRNGSVWKVTDSEVYFHISEFGWARTAKLRMITTYGD